MALITCPECGREISDKAESCPNCGYVLVKNELPKIRRTELSEPQKNAAMGVTFIIMGICALICTIFIAPIIFISIFTFFGGFAFIYYGAKTLAGIQKGNCPYCGNAVTVPAKDKTYKCPHCSKISTHNGNFLETIE